MSEVSTNGTRKDYTYDDHERLASVKETGLDGKWLKQVYAYNNDDDGLLSSTLLICNTDTLGTKKYYYENGYRTVTSFTPHNAPFLPDTILVWKLTSESDLGVYHANARLYDPLTGRFLGYDPYVQDPDNTQNWNRYSYCLNNPFRYSDPEGEFAIK